MVMGTRSKTLLIGVTGARVHPLGGASHCSPWVSVLRFGAACPVFDQPRKGHPQMAGAASELLL